MDVRLSPFILQRKHQLFNYVIVWILYF